MTDLHKKSTSGCLQALMNLLIISAERNGVIQNDRAI